MSLILLLSDFLPFDPTIKRTEGTLRNTRTGAEFKTTKGAPHVILGLLNDSDGGREVRDRVESQVARFGEMGVRTLAVARMDGWNGEWKMMGLLTFLDPPRPDTKQTIIDAKKIGAKCFYVAFISAKTHCRVQSPHYSGFAAFEPRSLIQV